MMIPLTSLILSIVLTASPSMFTPDLTCRARGSKGQLIRSRARLTLFKRATGFPKGRPGYIIDHIIPLACGGCDVPSNMQWQTVLDAKAKDKVERKECGGQ